MLSPNGNGGLSTPYTLDGGCLTPQTTFEEDIYTSEGHIDFGNGYTVYKPGDMVGGGFLKKRFLTALLSQGARKIIV